MEFSLSFDFILHLLTAFGLGALFGLERARREKKTDTPGSLPGIRTYSLISILGFVSATLAIQWGILVFLLTFLLGGGLILFSYWQEAKLYHFIGITSEISSLLVFLLGGFVVLNIKMAVIVAALALWVLALQKPLRKFPKTISKEELIAILKFIIVAFVVLPLLPQEAIDPWGVIVPYKAWLMVIFISGLSFLGYILTKFIGVEKGIGITGLVGGLASSTATTSSMATSSRKHQRIVAPFVFAVVAASSIMFVRIGFTVFVLNQALFFVLLWPLLFIVLICAGVLFFLYHQSKKYSKVKSEPLILKSPFQLKPALLFGGFYIIILLLAHFMNSFFGEKGLLIASALSGLTDVDAITLSLTELTSSNSISTTVATQGILIAAFVNTAVKLFLARLFGGKAFARLTTIAFCIILLGAFLTLLSTFLNGVFLF
jgi:uncharacterized membrane protein (DUF4010 family)